MDRPEPIALAIPSDLISRAPLYYSAQDQATRCSRRSQNKADPANELAGWRGEHHENRCLTSGPALVSDDREISFNWGTAPPVPQMPDGNFGAHWTRQVAISAGYGRFSLPAQVAKRTDHGCQEPRLVPSQPLPDWRPPNGLRLDSNYISPGATCKYRPIRSVLAAKLEYCFSETLLNLAKTLRLISSWFSKMLRERY